MENNANQNKNTNMYSILFIQCIQQFASVSPFTHTLISVFARKKLRLQASMVLNRGVNAREIFTQKMQKQNHKTELDRGKRDDEEEEKE